MAIPGQRYCEKCGRLLNNSEFYQSNNKEKYPEGFLNQCKKCITMHVDNWNPESFLWILQEADVPWVPEEWNKLMYKYAQNAEKVSGMTIMGRYLSKMRLKQHKDFRWKDTEFIQQVNNSKIEQAMKAQGYGAAEIAQVIEKNTIDMPERPALPETPMGLGLEYAVPPPMPIDQVGFPHLEQEEYEELDLTDEDKTYLRLKWGKMYKPDEWVQLEQLYNDMMQSYDIQAAGHIDNLKLLCKTSLKCNQLIDIGDVEGYQKMSKVYDSLMKSGKFTAAQNKEENGEFVDSVGELVMLCETDGYIEKYYVTDPKDKVDDTLADMKRYTRTLVSEETNLNQLLEMAIKMNAQEDEKEAESPDEDIVLDDDIDIDAIEAELQDDDFVDYGDFLDEEAEADEELLKSLAKEDYI